MSGVFIATKDWRGSPVPYKVTVFANNFSVRVDALVVRATFGNPVERGVGRQNAVRRVPLQGHGEGVAAPSLSASRGRTIHTVELHLARATIRRRQ